MARSTLLPVLAVAFTPSLFAQCATVYVDGAVSSDRTNVHAWSVLTDNYTNQSSGCVPWGWTYFGSFTHTYTVSTTITSPRGRTATGYGSSSQQGGYSAGYDRADVTIPVLDDWGSYQVVSTDKIVCSVAGVFFLATIMGSDQTVAPPTVSVTAGPTNILTYTGGSQNSLSQCVDITAAGQPAGGSYAWTTSSSTVALTNTSSATVHVCANASAASGAAGDVDIAVTYTVNSRSSDPGHTKVTVLKPTSLRLGTDVLNPTGHTCIQGSGQNTCSRSYYSDNVAGSTYTSYCRSRTYQVLDQFTGVISLGMKLSESYAGANPTTGSGSGAVVTDCFYFCSQLCRQQQNDSISATQSIYANGFQVATKSVQWQCSDAIVQ